MGLYLKLVNEWMYVHVVKTQSNNTVHNNGT